MHFHFPFTAQAVLWTLTFASHLVLLVVLLGRDRIARFPWFTASIVVITFRLLTTRLLFNRIPQINFAEMVIVTLDIGAVIALLVVVEVARRAFGRARRAAWLIGALSAMAVGAAVLVFWGQWPAWKATVDGPPLDLLQLLAQKTNLLADVENVVVGLLVVVLGWRYGAGWRSHTQRIAIGLSTTSLSQLATEFILDRVAHTAVVNSRADYTRLIDFRDRLLNANNAVYIVVVVFWIWSLWVDEPGQAAAALQETAAAEDEGAIVLPVEDGDGGLVSESPESE